MNHAQEVIRRHVEDWISEFISSHCLYYLRKHWRHYCFFYFLLGGSFLSPFVFNRVLRAVWWLWFVHEFYRGRRLFQPQLYRCDFPGIKFRLLAGTVLSCSLISHWECKFEFILSVMSALWGLGVRLLQRVNDHEETWLLRLIIRLLLFLLLLNYQVLRKTHLSLNELDYFASDFWYLIFDLRLQITHFLAVHGHLRI